MAQGNGARRWRRGGIRDDDVSERGDSNACRARVPLSLQFLSFLRDCKNEEKKPGRKLGRWKSPAARQRKSSNREGSRLEEK